MEETRRARDAGLDLDHAVAMVHQRTKDRYAALRAGGDEDTGEKLLRLTSTEANVSGIMRWLGKADQPAHPG